MKPLFGAFFLKHMSIQDFYNSIFKSHPIICTDSRNISQNCLFFALKGDNFNGNLFAEKAISDGAAYAIIDDNTLTNSKQCIYVENVLEFLQKLANYHRHQCKSKIIGITGTNGKTTTKELISAVLSKKYKITYTKGNLNNHIGVPLTLLTIEQDTEISIIEMGANHQKEIEFLCSIADPDYGIITNIGKAHIQGFGSFENIIETKTELYKHIASKNGVIFQDSDNEILTSHSQGISQIISYGFNSNALNKGVLISSDLFASFKYSKENESIEIFSQLFGDYNAKNMLTAATIGAYFGVSLPQIKEAIESYSPSNNRSQHQKTAKNTLILDAYNANPTSMKAALEQFSKMPLENACIILGEMYELGDISETEHRNILTYITSIKIPNVFLVGNWPKIPSSNFNYFENSLQLLEYLEKTPLVNKVILIKGSRGVKLETIVKAL